LKYIFLAVFVIFTISAISVASFASSASITAVSSQTKYGSLTSIYFETSSGPASSTPSTNTASIPSSSSGYYAVPMSSTAYLWSPQFGSATTISAGNWVLDFWSSVAVVSDVPITITNSQSSATSNPFQAIISWNPSSYTNYEAANLGNIRFYADNAFSQPLYGWLESCTPSLSNSATNATAWIKLTSSIAANGGTLKIYMAFLSTTTTYDGNYWGEAPNLSGTYGAIDNGANVFNAYFNGNTATSNFSVYSGDTLTKATGISGPGGTTINAINVTGTTNAHVPAFSFNKAISNTALIAESSFCLTGNTADATGTAGLVDNAAVTSVKNGITAQMGYSSSYFSQAYEIASAVTLDANPAGTANTNWVYASVTYSGSAASSWSAYIAPQLYSTTGGYSGTVTNNPLSSASNLYLGQISGSLTISVCYNYMRARVYPPNNVMPSVSLGSLTLIVNTVSLSIYATDASGNILSTIASSVPSPAIGTSQTQIAVTIAGSQVNVPQNGYIAVSIFATPAQCTLFWGQGQPTNFQVPYRILSGA